MRALPLRLLAVLLLVVPAAVAWATTVLRADVDGLAGLADVVVDGTVRKRSVSMDTARGAIWTHYEVEVAGTWLGEERETVVVDVPGGTAGDLSQEISGTAELREGERAVLFLAVEGDHRLVLGQAQGCFRVTKADDGRTLVCENRVEGLVLVDTDGKRVDAEPIRMEHAALERRVKAVARRRADEERRRREEQEKRLAELRERAERNAERTRGKPGGAE